MEEKSKINKHDSEAQAPCLSDGGRPDIAKMCEGLREIERYYMLKASGPKDWLFKGFTDLLADLESIRPLMAKLDRMKEEWDTEVSKNGWEARPPWAVVSKMETTQ